jgi:folate-binding protein YgfZ
MTDQWQDFQATRQAAYSRPLEGLVQARDNAIVCDLTDYALLAFDGPDAADFLHRQLSSDVQALSAERCQLATYNSPKGRVLATLTLWRTETGFLVQLPAAIAEPIRRRLSMYILRSKVQASDVTDRFLRFGIGGPNAQQMLIAAGLPSPETDYGLIRGAPFQSGEASGRVDYALRLGANRYELVFAETDSALAVWRALEEHGAKPAEFAAWRWLTLVTGIAEVGAETQDQFVAQMLNYELIGGISFTKGCYPGQEIVARTQYRGEVKRRTVLGHAAAAQEPAAGSVIFSEGTDQPIGMVINCAASPASGYDLLACLHLEFAAASRLHLGTPDGPQLVLNELPYHLPKSV